VELDAESTDAVVEAVAAMEPTFGGINLEDIAAPACFEIEARLSERIDVPVFHDDQHGTAIITGAALLNGAEIQEKRLEDLSVVVSGAGASAIATARFYTALGVPSAQITMVDSTGILTQERAAAGDLNEHKAAFAQDRGPGDLADAMAGADVFVGLSVGDLVTPEMVRSMAPRPMVFAMANPDPEIGYAAAKSAREDTVVAATGRSDYPNQINNVLGFPFIFRGALDVRATEINESMKVAAARALASLAHEPVPESVRAAYDGEALQFGPDYVIPKPFDSRVLTRVAPAVAEAAMDAGVARRTIEDLSAYRDELAARIDSV
jgi:malate dehydrogenase (oxaloacetate-decarboxylating)(NADP+)